MNTLNLPQSSHLKMASLMPGNLRLARLPVRIRRADAQWSQTFPAAPLESVDSSLAIRSSKAGIFCTAACMVFHSLRSLMMSQASFSKLMSNPFGANGVWKLHCIHCGLLSNLFSVMRCLFDRVAHA